MGRIRSRIRDWWMWFVIRLQWDIYEAGIAEGRQLGREEGLQRGYRDGYKEGHSDGYHEGFTDAKHQADLDHYQYSPRGPALTRERIITPSELQDVGGL